MSAPRRRLRFADPLTSARTTSTRANPSPHTSPRLKGARIRRFRRESKEEQFNFPDKLRASGDLLSGTDRLQTIAHEKMGYANTESNNAKLVSPCSPRFPAAGFTHKLLPHTSLQCGPAPRVRNNSGYKKTETSNAKFGAPNEKKPPHGSPQRGLQTQWFPTTPRGVFCYIYFAAIPTGIVPCFRFMIPLVRCTPMLFRLVCPCKSDRQANAPLQAFATASKYDARGEILLSSSLRVRF